MRGLETRRYNSFAKPCDGMKKLLVKVAGISVGMVQQNSRYKHGGIRRIDGGLAIIDC